ncbi:cytochrome P450 [Annulohypoxylon maeteangense]|uniref:cytochrome P450 n=1 Tax=Annulohypoxylon maeteangense TaxID=1927788 RepID=UPI00200749F7|nr:cytochrome P450 [Annulohypoxylon maeteangense]KAI0888399.1 cytochrome P450 [Annulohypoxylon maeteangense]
MDYAELLTVHHLVLSLSVSVGIWMIYQLLNTLYNLSPLHPLSHIPGPWLSRGTYLPEFYYDLMKYGRYTKRIQKMHEKYGPIVRISPDEVHCSDINFVDEIYAVGNRKRNKPLHLISGSAHTESGFGTMDHALHKLRRGPVAKFFARGMISRLEDDIHKLSQVLCDKILKSGDSPIDVVVAYSCFASDTISSYCFGESFGFLDQEGWYPNFHVPEIAILKPAFALRFFPVLRHLFSLGDYFMDYLPADFALLIRTLRVDVPKQVKSVQAELDSGVVRDRPTIFSSLLELPREQKEALVLGDEAAALLGAGTITASWTLSVITYVLLTKPEMLAKLTKELEDAIDDPRHLPNWNVLETLPYLDGVIQEGLRLSYGVSARSPRVATEENLVYRGEWNKKPVEYVIPKGYAIGMSCVISHHNEDIFPDSYSFKPERWLDAENRKQLDRGMFAFSKGSRSCLGMNLALCEIYVALAALTLRVFPRARLFETTEDDILYDHDMFVPMPKAGSKGVRIAVAAN